MWMNIAVSATVNVKKNSDIDPVFQSQVRNLHIRRIVAPLKETSRVLAARVRMHHLDLLVFTFC